MVTPTPGVLWRILQNMSGEEDLTIVGQHRKIILQIIGIVPVGDKEFPKAEEQNFYIKVSDTVNSAFVTLEDEDRKLVMFDRLRIGQMMEVLKVYPGTPYPVLQGVRALPRRNSKVGVPNFRDVPMLSFSGLGKKSVESFEELRSPRRCWKGIVERKERVASKSADNRNHISKFGKSCSSQSQGNKFDACKKLKQMTSRSSFSTDDDCNLVKVPLNSRKLTDRKIFWEVLPTNLIGPGKEALKRRDAAIKTAVEALQEASKAESVLWHLSVFANMCSSSKAVEPEPSIKQFLDIHKGLRNNAYAQGKSNFGILQNEETCSPSPSQNSDNDISINKAERASSWIRTALSSDLSSFTLLGKSSAIIGQNADKGNLAGSESFLVLENSFNLYGVKSKSPEILSKVSKSAVQSPRTLSNSLVERKCNILNDCQNRLAECSSKSGGNISRHEPNKDLLNNVVPKISTKKSSKQVSNGFTSREVARYTLDGIDKLGHELLCEAEQWFLKFLEDALEIASQKIRAHKSILHETHKTGLQLVKHRIVGFLSQLKTVTEWLDETGSSKGCLNIENTHEDLTLMQAMSSLRNKIYEFLLQNAEFIALTQK